eukprot:scaffold3054_cov129-Cylindrotheca_fusiformis.AAC.13
MQIKRSIDDYNEDDEAKEKLRAAADWSGPVENRYCTDLLWLILLLISWLAMTVIGIIVVRDGDARLVLYPLDYDGNVCGTDYKDRDMTEYPYLYYTNAVGGVCVKECPSLEGVTADNLTDMYTLVTYTGIFQTTNNNNNAAQVPADFLQVANYSYTLDERVNDTSFNIFDTNNFQCTEDICWGGSIEASWSTSGINKGYGFAYYLADSFPLFQRCFLTSDARERISDLTNSKNDLDAVGISDEFEKANNLISHLYGDVWTARNYIIGFGFGVSLVVSLLYMLLLRIPWLLSSLVWFSIFAVIALVAYTGYFAAETAKEWEAADPPEVREDQINATEIASYVLYVIAAILLLLAICLRKQIQLAVFCVKQAGRAINSMVMIFTIPLLQGIGFLLFAAIWTFYGSYLASLGTITVEDLDVPASDYSIPVRHYEFSDRVSKLGWFMLFCFYWTASFIMAVGEMTVSMAVSKWYFTTNKRNVTQHVPFVALWQTIIYHLGTCAFGSLIIAIIRLLRSILEAIKKQISEMSNEKLAEVLFCCCTCCLCCLEKCVQFINENAYIQCAIFGTPFCESGRKAFFLILRNAARIGAVSYVSAAVLIVGKIFISAVTTMTAYYALVEYLQLELWSFAGPVVIIFIISYFVADMFMDVFDISILCILHCFVADEELFGGRARYAENSLKKFVDDHGGTD